VIWILYREAIPSVPVGILWLTCYIASCSTCLRPSLNFNPARSELFMTQADQHMLLRSSLICTTLTINSVMPDDHFHREGVNEPSLAGIMNSRVKRVRQLAQPCSKTDHGGIEARCNVSGDRHCRPMFTPCRYRRFSAFKYLLLSTALGSFTKRMLPSPRQGDICRNCELLVLEQFAITRSHTVAALLCITSPNARLPVRNATIAMPELSTRILPNVPSNQYR